MMAKNILIVEDNQSNLKMLEQLVLEIDDTVWCHCVNNINDAYKILHEIVIDVFVLDIILDVTKAGDMSGIRLAEEIREINRYKFTPIIFITSLSDPKMYAYSRIHSYQYIEKPFNIKDTKSTLQNAMEHKTAPEKQKDIDLVIQGIWFSIKEEDIVYIESTMNKLNIYLVNDKVSVPYMTCKQIMEKLNKDDFVKCSRNAILNRKHIVNVDVINRCANIGKAYGNVNIGKKYLDEVLKGIEL